MLQNYTPFGPEWKAEVLKMNKEDIVNQWAESMQYKNIIPDFNTKSCEKYVLGILNDFEGCLISKNEALDLFGKYTLRLHDAFWQKAKEIHFKEPELFNQ